ncbi:inactive LRR receptor-like serine/threonine-protein kinase BIR2 [Asparagus officinalis]|uniref:inactive LRR receptor-like serine/threonine-protein kinase BIR2 n=1 Tax=Asparagus officinalis TaxID=4686 RepID=UPI00098DF322|nr:inactive LRR receptor-like serine/threonine-protein kinase BIR2 [Asparagus officinalis]
MATPKLIILTTLILLIHQSIADPSDESCLSSLHSSLSDPNSKLRNWTKPNFANPCNGFTSLIAGATCNNGRIFKLSLPSLSLSGSLPSLISNCTNLQTLDLSDNLLSGPIPDQISLLLNLAVLNLSSNLLSGQIPPQLALCSYLNVIDLHSNRLSGPIPDQLGLLVRLSAFDVSNNELEGSIPVSLANRSNGGGPRFNASSFVGNRGLYGFPLGEMRGRGLSVMAIVGIGIGSGLISLVISFTAELFKKDVLWVVVSLMYYCSCAL